MEYEEDARDAVDQALIHPGQWYSKVGKESKVRWDHAMHLQDAGYTIIGPTAARQFTTLWTDAMTALIHRWIDEETTGGA